MHAADWGVAGAMVLMVIATAYGAQRARRHSDYGRLVPGAVVTVFGLLALVAFYRWGFEEGSCDGRGDIVCLTNKNQGILTLLALLLAALAVWVEVVMQHTEGLRQHKERIRHANQAVGDAIGEAHHNLLHVALCYSGNEMTNVPWGMSIDDICALAQQEYRHVVDEEVLGHLDRIRRTYDSMQEQRNRFVNASTEPEREEARKEIFAESNPFQGFVMHHLGLLVDAWYAYKQVPGCRERLQKPGLQDLPRIQAANAGRSMYFYFRTSDEEAQEEAPTIRTEEAMIVCWFDDKPIGVPTFALGPRFADAGEAHVH